MTKKSTIFVLTYVGGLERTCLIILIYDDPKFESLDIARKKLERAQTLFYVIKDSLAVSLTVLSREIESYVSSVPLSHNFGLCIFTDNCERASLAISILQFTYVSRR